MRMRRPRLARAGSLAAAVFCLAALCSPTRVLSLFEVCDTFGDDGCQDEGSVCKTIFKPGGVMAKVCVCDESSGYWHGGGDLGCVEIPGFCIEDSDCESEVYGDNYYNPVCDHKIDRCTCEHLGWEPGTYVHNGEGLCAWPTFGECETDEDCNEGAICSGIEVPSLEPGWEPGNLDPIPFMCICAEGYIYDSAGGGTCIQKETLGNVCSTDADCIIPNGWSENQVCKLTYESSPPSWSKKCVCDNGYEAVEGKCKAIPGYCEEGGDCRHPERTWWSSFNPFDKQCVNTRCVCTNSYVEDESTYTCTYPGPANSCDSSSDCNAENNEGCFLFNNEGQMCICAIGYTFDPSSGDCLPSDTLGKPCPVFGDCGKNEICKVTIEGGLYAETCECDAANGWMDDGEGVCVWNWNFCTTNQQCANQIVDSINPASVDKVCDKDKRECVCPPGSNLDIYETGCDPIPGYCSKDADCSVPCEVPGSPGIGCSADNGKICDIEKNVCTLPGTIDLPDWGEGPTPVQPNQESEPAPGLLTFPTLPSTPGPGLATSGFSFERRGRKEDSREEDRRQDDEDRDQDRDEDRDEDDEDDDEEDFRLATLTLGR
uniref:EGF-like domain-containing protein n=1 Tax=Chloropicon laureae TaxID=464258 RepID=A0A7S2YXB4_9CHLO|mmetsp:Transcript_11782/g.30500  ORF Transcript_11782/g.30500 Transcript_11782/m.30500 type:complete len:599 (+) Transcript_11782:314-2110(+)